MTEGSQGGRPGPALTIGVPLIILGAAGYFGYTKLIGPALEDKAKLELALDRCSEAIDTLALLGAGSTGSDAAASFCQAAGLSLEKLGDAGPARLAAALLLVLPILWLLGVRLWLAPRFGETHALIGDWTVHAESLPLFLLGFVLATCTGFWNWAQRLRWRTLAIALLAIGLELGLRWLGRHPPAGPI